VRAALESGDLPPRRYESWQKLQREIAYETRRKDVRLQAEQRAMWKRIHKEVRGHNRP
jgi:ribosome biogenesis GTPase